MDEVLKLLAEAKTLTLAGNYDEAEAKIKQADGLKRIAEMEAAAKSVVTATATAAQAADTLNAIGGSIARLPFASAQAETPAEAEQSDIAAKSWYIRRFGDTDAGADQIAKELYGAPLHVITHAKYVALNQFLRRGWTDDRRLENLLVYTKAQLTDGLGWTVREIKATQVEAQDTLGGFVVPEDLRMEVIQRLPGMTVVRGLAQVDNTSRDLFSKVKRTGGGSRYIGAGRVTWTDESPASASTTQTNVTLGKVQIPVHVTMANVPISRSLLEDAAIDIVGYVREELMVAMAIDEDEQFLVGNGVGKPQGILNGTAASGAPFDGDITTVNSGSASALTADGLVSMPMKIDAPYRSSPSCVWVGAKATYEAIYKLKDGAGRYLWRNNDDNLSQGYPKQLQGYAIRESEAMPAVAANTYPLIFGDFKRGYQIADRVGVSLERYQDSNTQATDSVMFYARRRLGGQVVAGWAFAVQKVST